MAESFLLIVILTAMNVSLQTSADFKPRLHFKKPVCVLFLKYMHC